MKKYLKIFILMTAFVGLLVACKGSDEKKELNIYTWEGMFPDEVLSNFEKDTGIKINYSNFDTDETMLAKLEADKTGIYDLIIANDYILQTIIEKGLAQKIDASKIKNYDNIDPAYQGLFYDSTDEYTIPYGAGVQTIVYDPERVDVDITGYKDLWDPSLKDSIGIIGNYRVINGMALKVLGKSYNTENLDDIRAAGDELLTLAPNIRMIKDDNLQDDLIAGEISAAIMYTSQVTLAKINRPDLKVVFPTEGIGFGTMPMFIPHNAPNSEAALQFIDYIFDGEVAAACFEHLGYYTTNKASVEFISEEYLDFLTLPTDLNFSTMETIQPISVEAEEVHSNVWTAFKSTRD